MKTSKSKSSILNARMARVSSLLTLGLAVLGPEMKLPKAWAASAAPVSNAGSFSWSSQVDWANAGAEFQNLAPSFDLPVTAGLSLTVSSPTGFIERRDQGSGWMGCMDSGEALLWKHEGFELVTEPLTVSFSTPVIAVGANIQNDAYGEYSGWIEAFDINNQSLGVFSASANASYCTDGGAAFVGLDAGSALISSVKFWVQNTDSFALGSLNILSDDSANQIQPQPGLPAPAPVPEAGTMAAASVFGLLLVRWAIIRKTSKSDPMV